MESVRLTKPRQILSIESQDSDTKLDAVIDTFGEMYPENMYVCFRHGKDSFPAFIAGEADHSLMAEKIKDFSPANLEQQYLLDALLRDSIKMLTVFGGAGSGKTYVTMSVCLYMLSKKRYSKIILTKSRAQASTGSAGRIGDVPGSLLDKMRPVLSSYERALSKIWGDKYLSFFEQKINSGEIEIIPLEYMRGEDFTNCLVICDEAQNVELHQFKTLITRLGEKSKLILLADTDQIDEKDNRKGQLPPVAQMVNLPLYSDSHLTSHIELIEIKRSELAALAIEIAKQLA